METRETIDNLEVRIGKLVELHRATLAELSRERACHAELRAQLKALQQQAKADKEAVARLSLAVSMSRATDDGKAARAQVNRLLREVDECIRIVSSGI